MLDKKGTVGVTSVVEDRNMYHQSSLDKCSSKMWSVGSLAKKVIQALDRQLHTDSYRYL